MTILDAVRGLLRTVARFALHRGLRYQEVSDLLRRAFIEAVEEDLRKDGIDPTVSKVSVLTGLQRKDIKRLASQKDSPPASINLLTKVIGQWQSHPDYAGPGGKARALTVQGAESEFGELVRSVSVDLNHYTVLFGLEQANCIVYSDGLVSLRSAQFLDSKVLDHGLEMLTEDTADLVQCVEENLFLDPPVPNLHLTTAFDNILLDEADSIRSWLLDEGTSFHERVRLRLSKLDKDANPRLHARAAGVRVMVGAFSLVSVPKERKENNE